MLNKTLILKRNLFIFLFLLVILIVERFVFLLKFGFVYTGSDDMIFWQAATDYMQGIFHEPYFYGQNYNFMLEAFLAIPFLKLGMDYNFTFPIVTNIITLFPFILFAFVLYRKSYFIESFVFLIIPLTMPVEYSILTTITRGFVSGLFFISFLIYPILYPTKKKSFFIFGICASLSYIFNPNALIVAVPIGIYLFLNNYKSPLFYIINIVCSTPILYIEYLAKQFYEIHTDYKVCWMWKLEYSFKQLFYDLKHLDNVFSYLNPIIWNWGWLSLLILLFAGFYLIKFDKTKGISVFVSVIFIFFTLGINKVNDSMGIIFLSIPRMFLGIPLLLSITFLWSRKYLTCSEKAFKYSFVFIAVIFFFLKIYISPFIIEEHVNLKPDSGIAIKKISSLKDECSELAEHAEDYNIDLIIFLPDWQINVPRMEFYNYGCPLIEKNFKRTLLNVYEKRTWVYLKEKKSIRKNILLYGYVDKKLLLQNTEYEIISENPQITIIKNNNFITETFLNNLNIKLKRNSY
ncbi:MAG TPA: hypothetical protein PLC59_09445 [Bacteroidales bacterium]|nr:hypothetical protein [Bacteroidales bacterium]